MTKKGINRRTKFHKVKSNPSAGCIPVPLIVPSFSTFDKRPTRRELFLKMFYTKLLGTMSVTALLFNSNDKELKPAKSTAVLLARERTSFPNETGRHAMEL